MIRDHSQPCEHDDWRTHSVFGWWGCRAGSCPGGAVVDPMRYAYEHADREAAANALHQHGPMRETNWFGPGEPQTPNWRDCYGAKTHEDASRRVIAAALRVSDDE